jgi:hypothetical protein
MKLINTNRFAMPGTNGRFVHIATVQDSTHEYICFWDKAVRKLYIEEITGGTLTYIDDDNLVKEISTFLFEKNITNLKYGAFEPD